MSKQYKWEPKTWSGYTSIEGNLIWTDGDNIYYSYGLTQRVLDKSTSTWTAKTWTGLTDFDRDRIWTDGDNIYYSYNEDQYVLDKSTSTWTAKTWTGLTDFNGKRIWTDGDNIYYSYNEDQYVLDKSTSTWTAKTWTGLTSFIGYSVWTDGDNIYYSNNADQYVLDKSTSTWTAKTWTGLTSFIGNRIWTDGDNIYYSNNADQYVLDKSTSTWTAKTWTGLTSFIGYRIWTDGDNIYYSQSTNHYILVEAPPTYLSKLTLPINVEGTVSNVEFTIKDAEARQMIVDLGHALYWMGVTTTVMSDGLATADVTISGDTVTPEIGGLVSYQGAEFVWNGSAWQEFGKNNFGALAFKSSASGDFTPEGTITVTEAADTTTTVTPFGTAGTAPDAYFTVANETATFTFDAGTLPTAGSDVTVVTASGARTAAFDGTTGTVTVE